MAQVPVPSKVPSIRYVYAIGDNILTSLCPFPPPSLAADELTPDDPDPSLTHLTCRSDNRYPTLSWVPAKSTFDSRFHVGS